MAHKATLLVSYPEIGDALCIINFKQQLALQMRAQTSLYCGFLDTKEGFCPKIVGILTTRYAKDDLVYLADAQLNLVDVGLEMLDETESLLRDISLQKSGRRCYHFCHNCCRGFCFSSTWFLPDGTTGVSAIPSKFTTAQRIH